MLTRPRSLARVAACLLAAAAAAQQPAPAAEVSLGRLRPAWLDEGARLLSAEDPLAAWRVFRAALGRPPNQSESTMLAELISGDNTAELVEDVLWAVTMLPEFQLVY